MKERNQSRLASGLIVLFGLWIALTPVWLQMSGGASLSTVIVGAGIAICGVVQYFWADTLPSTVVSLGAIWTFVSALILPMGNGAILNLIMSAIAVFFLSLWDSTELDIIDRRRRGRLILTK